MSKVDRIRSRPSDTQEGWKDGSDGRAGGKGSCADSVDPRAPSPGNVGQYNKLAAQPDFQVKLMTTTISFY